MVDFHGQTPNDDTLCAFAPLLLASWLVLDRWLFHYGDMTDGKPLPRPEPNLLVRWYCNQSAVKVDASLLQKGFRYANNFLYLRENAGLGTES